MQCHVCGKETKPTTTGKYRQHKKPDHQGHGDSRDYCDASGTKIPESELPGVGEYTEELTEAVGRSFPDRPEPVAEGFPFSHPAPLDIEEPPLFSRPAGRPSEQPAREMTALGKELTARLKEIFYAYDNRRSEDNRSAQITMGPSEMGTPCDRRLALSIMRMPPVNPGGDGWAAFVGTCIHAGLAEMFLWADADTGRFSVETPLKFDSQYVPTGTADLIDRTLFMLDDHKCQGRWSRNKLKSQGPSDTYRVQGHVYAHGARQRGEKIDYVAIISWPRDEATLDDLYVYTEPYDPGLVKRAFERVESTAELVKEKQTTLITQYTEGLTKETQDQVVREMGGRIAADFDVADDCRFCPFHMPGAISLEGGCNGRR